MGLLIINETNVMRNKTITAVKLTFQIFTTTILSLLLPLSFLLLARLSTAHYLLSVVSNNYTTIQHEDSVLSSLFLYTKNLPILHILISLISVSSLTHQLTGRKIKFLTPIPLWVLWIFLYTFQFCVGLGFKASVAAGIDGSGFGVQSSYICRMVFFFGLYETMSFWGRMVVKPVVDDTIFGVLRAEGLSEKVVMGLSYGGLCWWWLREELAALVVLLDVRRELTIEIGVEDFVGGWLYYLTVTIGMVKIVKGLIGMVTILTRRKIEGESRKMTRRFNFGRFSVY